MVYWSVCVLCMHVPMLLWSCSLLYVALSTQPQMWSMLDEDGALCRSCTSCLFSPMSSTWLSCLTKPINTHEHVQVLHKWRHKHDCSVPKYVLCKQAISVIPNILWSGVWRMMTPSVHKYLLLYCLVQVLFPCSLVCWSCHLVGGLFSLNTGRQVVLMLNTGKRVV